MAQTLSQEEVDALREAVKRGDDLEGATAAKESPDQVRVTAYNFRQPQIISGDQFHALRLVHESFGNTLQASLFATLKTAIEIKLVAVNQITYAEFVLSISNPTYVAVLSTKPDIGNIAMELNLSVATAMIDILLGGDAAFPFEDRGLTLLEKDILSEVINSVMAELSTAWVNVSDITFAVSAQESNPEYVQLTRPENPCLSVTFDVRLGETTGVLNLCYPILTIESVLARSGERSLRRQVMDGQTSSGDKMLSALVVVPLELHAVIGPTTISTKQLTLLKPGDIICLDKRITNPVSLFIEKRLSYTAELGQHQGKVAVSLMRPWKTDKTKKEEDNG